MKKTPTVLLIDDDTDDQEIFSFALEKAHEQAVCVFANDGMHALEKIKGDSSLMPDFIFIDMNMPRMNGQQCLIELKKIDRLKNVPVFMYSTFADPSSIAEHKKQGAEDFIQKPSDIKVLTDILSKIIHRAIIPLFFIMCCLVLPQKSSGQADTIPNISKLKKLTVEELINLEVTSVSRSPQKLKETASAIQVVLGEDIKRSGASRLPEALRLATNLQVVQAGSHDWGLSSRGFNGFPIRGSTLSNKLLVLIDGRSVYTPLFGGVFWDVQNVMLEDIDKIEVISGPGGALWGGNAVNGIINIKSKSAKNTQGLHASATYGSFLQDFATLRYGGSIDTTFFYRVYGQRFDFNNSRKSAVTQPNDEWYMNQGGMRMDYYPSSKNRLTLQGDLYGGKQDDTARTQLEGQNILGRWTHTISEKSGLIVQLYYDRTYRRIQRQEFTDKLTTYDMDLQHNFLLLKNHRIVWGLGYRISESDLTFTNNSFAPENRTLTLWNGFIQDQISLLANKVDLTIGTKVIHNVYTKFEYHPTIRIAWNVNETNTVWAAVSGGVRVPTRFDVDNNGAVLGSYGNFKSENVIAYELGYRVQPTRTLSVSLAAYYNDYTDLRSIDTNTVSIPAFYFANNLEAKSYGVELSVTYIASPWWKLRGGYTYMDKEFTYNSERTYPNSEMFESIDPRNQFLIQSMLDVTTKVQFDFVVRYVDVLPSAISIPSVPSYITFDLRLAWNYKWVTLSVVGQNLAKPYQKEFGTREIPRSVYGKIALDF